MKKDRSEIREILQMSNEQLLHYIYDASDEEICTLEETLTFELERRILGAKNEKEVKALTTAIAATSALDVEHSFYNGLHFELSQKAFGKKGNPEELKKIDFEDVIFDVKDEDWCIRISRNRYKIEVAGKLYTCYSCVIYYKPIKKFKNKNEYKIIEIKPEAKSSPVWTVELKFILEKLPRVFVEGARLCSACGRCMIKEFPIVNKNGDRYNPTFIVCSKRGRDSGVCDIKETIEVPTKRTIDEILDTCFYALSLYNNRRKRVTDTSEENGVLLKPKTQHKIHEAKEQKSETTFVTLKEYNRIERRIKREYQGGTHSSPVEHERRSHLRHYKNGKVVEVRSTVVNKGKGSNDKVYKVN